MKNKFSKEWKSSKSAGKQRKYQKNAPLHIKSKFSSAHLSAELRKKYNRRSLTLRKGDKIKILRGNFRGKAGKVENIDLKNRRVSITGIDLVKKDGTKVLKQFHPSNLIINELNLDDKRRFKRGK